MLLRLCGPDPTRSRPRGVAVAQLLAAAPGEDRVAVVRENILTFDPSFFLRIAARADTAEAAERDAMVALAGEVMTMLDKIVTETEKRSDKSGDTLTAIVASAAEADGQFQVPLSDAAVERMRAAVAEASTAGTLDEGVVGNAYAWIRKASEDNLDGMVVILQRVLQLYAQSEMPAEGGAPEAELIDAIVAADEEKWTQMLESGLKGACARALCCAGRGCCAPDCGRLARLTDTRVPAVLLPRPPLARRRGCHRRRLVLQVAAGPHGAHGAHGGHGHVLAARAGGVPQGDRVASQRCAREGAARRVARGV